MYDTLSLGLAQQPGLPAPRSMQLVDFLPLCQEADEYFELLLLSKLFFTRTRLTTEQLAHALSEHRKTGLSLEHLIVRNGYCDMHEALQVVAERRRVMSIIRNDLVDRGCEACEPIEED